MSGQDDPQNHPNLDAPAEIVANSSLSKQEKVEVLEDLEQDARQLAYRFKRGNERRRADCARGSAPGERGAAAAHGSSPRFGS